MTTAYNGHARIARRQHFADLFHAEMVLTRAIAHLKDRFGLLSFPAYLRNAEAQKILADALLEVQIERIQLTRTEGVTDNAVEAAHA